MIAGLPPAMGLYAAALPAIVGALFRSSRHVVTGPTNAVSLLVGTAVAAEVAHGGASPMTVGVTLAFMVGVVQFSPGCCDSTRSPIISPSRLSAAISRAPRS